MRRWPYFVPLGVFLILGVYFAVGLTKDPRTLPSMLINQPVPPLSLVPLKGRSEAFTNDDLKGQVTLVNIFGSWCFACVQEHPFLMQLKTDDAVPVFGIDWRETDLSAGPLWLARYGDPYTRVGADPESKAAVAFGVTGAPETFVVDRQGVIRYKHVGPLSPSVWAETIEPIVQHLRQE